MVKVKEFCVVILGDVGGAKDEIMLLAEEEVKFVNSGGLVVGTFKSAMTPNEIKSFLSENNRNFFLFEMGLDNFSVNFIDYKIYEHLFKEHDKMVTKNLETSIKYFEKVNLDEIVEIKEITNVEYIVNKVDKLTPKTQEELIDSILDKGLDNWSLEDKIIIEHLTRNS